MLHTPCLENMFIVRFLMVTPVDRHRPSLKVMEIKSQNVIFIPELNGWSGIARSKTS